MKNRTMNFVYIMLIQVLFYTCNNCHTNAIDAHKIDVLFYDNYAIGYDNLISNGYRDIIPIHDKALTKIIGDTTINFFYTKVGNKKIIIEKFVILSHFKLKGNDFLLWLYKHNLTINTEQDYCSDTFSVFAIHEESNIIYRISVSNNTLTFGLSYHPEYSKLK